MEMFDCTNKTKLFDKFRNVPITLFGEVLFYCDSAT